MTLGPFLKAAALAICLIASIGAAPSTMAQNGGTTLSAAELVDVCTRPRQAWIDFCHGYMQAVFDAAALRPSRDERLCPPAGTTRAAVAGAFARRGQELLDADPVTGGLPAIRFAEAVLFGLYGCRQ